jgi:2-keto-myo-inositol isomerase
MEPLLISRRKMLGNLGALSGLALIPEVLLKSGVRPERKNQEEASSFSFCLNTSSLRGHDLGLEKEIEICADAGYDGIEIWINSLQQYIDSGKSLPDLKKKTDDLGIKVENAIGFAQWIVDDNDTRTRALDQAAREMVWISGGPRKGSGLSWN